jgi:TPR repeat protein
MEELLILIAIGVIIAVIWGAVQFLREVWRIGVSFANAVSEEWDRTRPGRESISRIVQDNRLISTGLVITLSIGALTLGATDSGWLVSLIDGIGGRYVPLLGWVIIGGGAGVVMGVAIRIMELGWFSPGSISRVPDLVHLRVGETTAARYFRLRQRAAVIGAVILISALTVSILQNAGYDSKSSLEKKTALISTAGSEGRVTILNSALNDSANLLQSDPKTALKILVALKNLSKNGARPEIDRLAEIAQKYLNVFRDDTEKCVAEGKPDALTRSEAFSVVDKGTSLKWLGRLYETGKGVSSQNLSKAFSFYGEAAAMGDKDAAVMKDSVSHTMVSAKDDRIRQEAFDYLEPRAQSGGPSDQYWLGEWYENSGKPEDQKTAKNWFVKSAMQGSDVATKRLAFMALLNIKDVGSAATKILDEHAPSYATDNDEIVRNAAAAYMEKHANASNRGPGLRSYPASPKAKLAPSNQGQGRSAKKADVQEQPLVVPKTYQPVQPVATPPAADGRTSTFSVPANAGLNYSGHGWTCNSGYRQQEYGCVRVQIPENAGLDYTGHGWTCNRGYRQQEYGCVIVQIPENAGLDYTGHGWTCNRGYRQHEFGCVIVQIPENAGLDYTGHGWTCDKGYRQQGYECVRVQIPANASLDYTGHGWTCNRGYRRYGDECVP